MLFDFGLWSRLLPESGLVFHDAGSIRMLLWVPCSGVSPMF